MSDLGRTHLLKFNLLLFDFCLFSTAELGRGRRWTHSCGGCNFPQIQSRDHSNAKCRLNRERQRLPKQNCPGIHTSSPGEQPAVLSHTRGERNLHEVPQPTFAVWHMLQSMTRFIHLSPHGPKEIGFRETPCTFLDSHTHF